MTAIATLLAALWGFFPNYSTSNTYGTVIPYLAEISKNLISLLSNPSYTKIYFSSSFALAIGSQVYGKLRITF